VKVTWDPAKNRANLRKHEISFERAARLLKGSVDYLEIFDEAHSDAEDRFIAIGPIEGGLVLVVFTERDDDAIRVISARWATPRERALYHAHLEDRYD